MGILLTIAGIIIGFYTFSSVIGLWMSYQIMDAQAQGEGLPEILEDIEPHQIDLMSDYALGWRRHLWAASIVALFTTLLAMITGSHLAFWALGVSLMIDALLFMTYGNIRSFLDQTSLDERLLDCAMSAALFAAFALLFWVQQRAGEVLQ